MECSLKKMLFLASLEFLALGLFWFSVPSSPDAAGFAGYSLTRLGLIGLSLGLSAFMGFVAWKPPNSLASYLIRNAQQLVFPAWLFLLVTAIGLVVPGEFWGVYLGYFERVRPLLVIAGTLPAQILLPTILRGIRLPDWSFRRAFILTLACFVVLVVLIWGAGLGITPDPWFWNGAGMPLTMMQWLGILFTASLGAWLVSLIRVHAGRHEWVFDAVISILLFVVTAWVWTQTPMLKHYFSLQPQSPAFQPFPYSDARIYDAEAWSLLTGSQVTVDFKTVSIKDIYVYYSKPFYVAFLALLHRLAGDDYILMSFWNALVMAVVVPSIYWFGKSFHSRFFGLALALIMLFRQKNAIVMALGIASVNPLLLVTEILSMMFVILLCWAGFLWLRKDSNHSGLSLFLGGSWGALSLLRLSALGILPAFFGTALFAFWENRKVFWGNILIFMLGWVIVFTPWLATGRDVNGVPLLFLSLPNLASEFWLPSPKSRAMTLPEWSSQQTQSSAGQDKPFVEKFPGFMFNHTLHNGVNAFLTLPDSIFPADQSLSQLSRRPYWRASDLWRGEFPWVQMPLLIFNLFLIAVGIAWSWKRWRWAGLFPLIIFWNYVITLGLSRVSGSRYIVPVDWIVFFYYVCGLATILREVWVRMSVVTEDIPKTSARGMVVQKHLLIKNALSLVLVLLLALPVPLAYSGALKTFDVCAEQAWVDQHIQSIPSEKVWIGKILYPVLDQGNMSFYLASCGQRLALTANGLDHIPYAQFAMIFLNMDTQELRAISLWQDRVATPYWER